MIPITVPAADQPDEPLCRLTLTVVQDRPDAYVELMEITLSGRHVPGLLSAAVAAADAAITNHPSLR